MTHQVLASLLIFLPPGKGFLLERLAGLLPIQILLDSFLHQEVRLTVAGISKGLEPVMFGLFKFD